MRNRQHDVAREDHTQHQAERSKWRNEKALKNDSADNHGRECRGSEPERLIKMREAHACEWEPGLKNLTPGTLRGTGLAALKMANEEAGNPR